MKVHQFHCNILRSFDLFHIKCSYHRPIDQDKCNFRLIYWNLCANHEIFSCRKSLFFNWVCLSKNHVSTYLFGESLQYFPLKLGKYQQNLTDWWSFKISSWKLKLISFLLLLYFTSQHVRFLEIKREPKIVLKILIVKACEVIIFEKGLKMLFDIFYKICRKT